MSKQTISIASDHAGFNLKALIKLELEKKGFIVIDYGTDSQASVNYPDFAKKVALSIINEETEKGILICGTGIGISIAANRYDGVRAALCHDNFTAKMSRLHNNSNVLALGANVVGVSVALDMVDVWLSTEFEGGRHQQRINMLDKY